MDDQKHDPIFRDIPLDALTNRVRAAVASIYIFGNHADNMTVESARMLVEHHTERIVRNIVEGTYEANERGEDPRWTQ